MTATLLSQFIERTGARALYVTCIYGFCFVCFDGGGGSGGVAIK
jgi:hypothetical protein